MQVEVTNVKFCSYLLIIHSYIYILREQKFCELYWSGSVVSYKTANAILESNCSATKRKREEKASSKLTYLYYLVLFCLNFSGH